MYTILICDDDRDIVSALEIYLSSEGYRGSVAAEMARAMRVSSLWRRGLWLPRWRTLTDWMGSMAWREMRWVSLPMPAMTHMPCGSMKI